MKRRAFTLLEVVVVIALIALASGALGWKLHQMIAKKRFTSSAERLRSRLHTCRRLALNCQADWKGVLTWNGKKWVFETFCPDSPGLPPLPPLSLDYLVLFLDREEKKFLTFDFTATGEVYPKGILTLSPSREKRGADQIVWKLPDIFLLEEGKKLGPVHPEEIKK